MTEIEPGALDRRLLIDLSAPGRAGVLLPSLDVPEQDLPEQSLLRQEEPDLPEVSQGELVRYFTRLSQLNFSIDTNFYPLGSCTMKYNPRINEDMAALPGMSQIHPNQPDETVQGALQLMWELQRDLGEITGLPAVCLDPLAGAQGEYAGLLVARAYHEDRGDDNRTIALVPDSAHGTNPASAAMAGLDVKSVPSDSQGNVDVDALKEIVDERVAVFMLTL
ncbi:MAG: aminomethyl-transferring glycine dehydrogenase subunit GcvPB, partial [Chloroflexota bacterium]